MDTGTTPQTCYNPRECARARQFVDWEKNNFLTEDGKYHPNIFIFDFWGIVVEDDPNPPNDEENCLKYGYERSHTDGDSHPNTAANQTAGPLFAQSIIDAIRQFNNSAPTRLDVDRKIRDFKAGTATEQDVKNTIEAYETGGH